MDRTTAALPEEIAERRRKCWHTTCNRTARLEWCGWRWCVRHWWASKMAWQSTASRLVVLRWTRIIRN